MSNVHTTWTLLAFNPFVFGERIVDLYLLIQIGKQGKIISNLDNNKTPLLHFFNLFRREFKSAYSRILYLMPSASKRRSLSSKPLFFF